MEDMSNPSESPVVRDPINGERAVVDRLLTAEEVSLVATCRRVFQVMHDSGFPPSSDAYRALERFGYNDGNRVDLGRVIVAELSSGDVLADAERRGVVTTIASLISNDIPSLKSAAEELRGHVKAAKPRPEPPPLAELNDPDHGLAGNPHAHRE